MTGWEMTSGVCVYEIDVMLSADTGREKHTDLEEQGAWLLIPIDRALRSAELTGMGFGSIRYVGVGPTGRRVVDERPVSGGIVRDSEQQSYDLRDIIDRLSEIISDYARRLTEAGEEAGSSHPDAEDLFAVVEWSLTRGREPDAAAAALARMRTHWRLALDPPRET